MNAVFLDHLLRSPAEVAKDCRDDHDVAPMAANALITIGIGAVLFGAAVGSWHGGHQIAFSALKLPIVTIGTLAICVPGFYAIAAVFGRPWPLRAVVSLMLVAGARFSLVLLAATPVLWLTINLGAPYHLTKLCAALAYALAGLSALGLHLRGLGDGPGKKVTIVLFIGLFLMVGGQAAWILRPYIGRPDRAEVSMFTREREGGMAYQLWVSARELLWGSRGGNPPPGSSRP
jgi:hypothetical protein